jgi:hypothetical protein
MASPPNLFNRYCRGRDEVLTRPETVAQGSKTIGKHGFQEEKVHGNAPSRVLHIFQLFASGFRCVLASDLL